MSRRIYITLNEKKDKDKVILKYLSSSYSESGTIKEVLYRIATNRYNLNLNPVEEIDLKGADRCEKVIEVVEEKENEKVQVYLLVQILRVCFNFIVRKKLKLFNVERAEDFSSFLYVPIWYNVEK